MADLDEAIAVARQAVDATPANHPDRAAYLNNLGNNLKTWFERTGHMADLDEAIAVARQAVDATPADHITDCARRLSNLGSNLAIRYERTGQMVDLAEAIAVARQAVDAMPADHPDRAACLTNLGNLLQNRYKRIGQMVDLAEAIAVARQAVDAMPADHPDRAAYLTNLGNLLQSRYERIGQMVDLAEAIAVARQAVDAMPADHPDRAACLSNLGNKLEIRYKWTGQMVDLAEAIDIAKQVVDRTPPADHLNYASRLHNLGNMLESRYNRTEHAVDLDKAIAIARKAVDVIPADYPDRTIYFNSLGNKLKSRYARDNQAVDLEEAIAMARQAVDATPAGHTSRMGYLNNLGNMLRSQYDRTKEAVDLDKAIAVARQALDATPDDHPNRVVCLINLGEMIWSQFKQTGRETDLEKASVHFEDAWNCQNAIPFHRVQAAANCLLLLSLQSKCDAAIQLGLAVLDLLPAVNTKVLDRSDQQFVMSTFAGISNNLCACFLAKDQPESALENLERGRAVIIGQLVDTRNDLSSLRPDHNNIARRYENLREEINKPAGDCEQGTHRAQAEDRRRAALAKLDECIKDIRHLPGHERFLLGQTAAEMRKCAAGGTIVVVNINDLRSDAILISQTAIRPLSLSCLLVSEARDWLSKTWTGGEVSRAERANKNREYLDYLRWLWESCVKLVLDEVDTNKTANALPRIWWIGTGLGSSMPFHAAGIHSSGSTENAFSKAISSYAPSIKALAYAHRRAKETKDAQVSLMIATMPTTPANDLQAASKPSDLPGVLTEQKRVTELWAGKIPVQPLNFPSAAQAVDRMRDCTIAHFACHGTTDHTDPSSSGLILQKQDEQGLTQDRLTVRRVSELNLPSAHIAYLSACSTAENKAARLSDEVIHVVSGFQVAGFPHVVGCLWPSLDRICVEVAGGFYRALLRQRREVTGWDGREVACAVREAVMAVREEDMGMPFFWAQFVHFGA